MRWGGGRAADEEVLPKEAQAGYLRRKQRWTAEGSLSRVRRERAVGRKYLNRRGLSGPERD